MESRKIPIKSAEFSNPSADSEDSYEPSAEFRVVDKRHFMEADRSDDHAPIEEKPRYPSYVEELRQRTSLAESRYAERVKQLDQEIAKVKSRLETDYERRLALAKRDMLLPFLDVLDNLERALKAAPPAGNHMELYEGLRLTADLFRAKLRTQGIEPITVVGQAFDPNVSQAVGTTSVPDQTMDGVVVEEVLRGYRLRGDLVRPAQVRVGRYEMTHSVSS